MRKAATKKRAQRNGLYDEDPDGPLVIFVGRQATGCTYELGPVSEQRIRDAFPRANIAPRVFIAYEAEEDFEKKQAPIWDHMAVILTGLSIDQINQLGGIRIYDPETETGWGPALSGISR